MSISCTKYPESIDKDEVESEFSQDPFKRYFDETPLEHRWTEYLPFPESCSNGFDDLRSIPLFISSRLGSSIYSTETHTDCAKTCDLLLRSLKLYEQLEVKLMTLNKRFSGGNPS